MTEKKRNILAFLMGLAAVLAAALWLARQTGADFFAHCLTDSYTQQALAWRAGRTTIEGEMPWLELAIYNGRQYLSFPPVPTIPLWVMTFFFGGNTPSGLMTLLYLLGGYAAAFFLCARRMRPGSAALLAAFACAGGSLLDIAVSDANFCGAVWYQAQMLAFLMTMLAFLLVDGKRRAGWYGGLVCYALAIGCRPLNIALAPALLWVFGERLANGERFGWRLIRRAVPFCVAPFLIGCAYGCYNLARFGSFFEFGHIYLPEYTNSGDPVFSLAFIGRNLRNLLRMPAVWQGWETMPTTGGFAAYLTQPGLTAALVWVILRAARGKLRAADALLFACVAAQCLLLTLHRTLGGWQYGARYWCDTVPAVVYLRARVERDAQPWETALLGGAAAFNLLATAAFHML